MKKKPNWKLMSEKDKEKYRAKNGVKTPKSGRKRAQKPMFMSVKESKELCKKARIPRHLWVRPEKPNQEKQRVVL